MAIETTLSYPEISPLRASPIPPIGRQPPLCTAIPILDRLIKKLTEVGYERKVRQMMLGNAVRLGEDQLPEVWAMQRRYAHTFDIAKLPEAVCDPGPGGKRPHDRRQRAR